MGRLRRTAIILVAMTAWCVTGCRISRNIVDVAPPPGQPPLQQLEQHLDYTDPDAGRPDYVRTR